MLTSVSTERAQSRPAAGPRIGGSRPDVENGVRLQRRTLLRRLWFNPPKPAAPHLLQWRVRFEDDTDLGALKLVLVLVVGAAGAALEVLP